MKIRSACIVLTALVLSGCSSPSSSLTYYLLHAPAEQVEVSDVAPATIQLRQLTLPEYVKQRSLAMQTSATTVYFSNRHVWAEPLEHSIQQALSGALLSRGNIEMVSAIHHSKMSPAAELYVKIEDFIPSSDGNVLIKGRFWLESEKKSEDIQYFDFRRSMKGDGFDQAVVTMRLLINDLADAIIEELQQTI